ncbi:HlyD family efflux transporter periplasmic adaptor subunit [Sinirhodobacter sp. WL0062]|uniref:HlyD family efflux transporter periplasmic adaptor subunit n=1 Tax=Rhodobacter flavimaris TaxID=2907145 RepID=A0ABS8YYJ8_9RHOB|nr:HlyD family efflux transporter periplasmic adaptor subunit [Sinirhodobacter sp. WL0062]
MAQAWLAALARQSGGIDQGLVVLAGIGRSRFEPAAVWPERAKPQRELMTAIDDALRADRMVIETVGEGGAAVAVPIRVDGQLRGAAGILIGKEADAGVDLMIDRLQWATGWIEAFLRRKQSGSGDSLASVVELLATSLHHERFAESATAVVSELAGALNCELVAIGLQRGRHVRVQALSNSASFGKRSNLVRAIEAAMDEAIDQQAVLNYPAPEGGEERVLRAHATLSEAEGGATLCTVPLTEDKKLIGALLLERPAGEAFGADAVQMAEYAGVLLGPVLSIKRREDRWLPAKAWDASVNTFKALVGPNHAALKLTAILAVAALAFAIFAKGMYRVTADAVVEGRIQRAASAPTAGYLAEAEVRAGDIVKADDVMARLDDRDLRLERLKWETQKVKQSREYSEAMAKRERAKALILQSQIEQADAQISLLDQEIERLVIRAPFDGVVVSGDLTQALGAPIERGDVLFQIAPLDDYRVMLRVDERDVKDMQVGKAGALVLAALPDTPVEVQVERITPISTAEEGTNKFVVEASVTEGPIEALRPGMEGVAKIEVEEHRLVWIWTRRIVLWVRMAFWSWWP